MGNPETSSFGDRAIALVIDSIIINVSTGLVIFGFIIISGSNMAGENIEFGWTIFGLILGWLYYSISESSYPYGTYGKKVVGIKVVGMDNKPISFDTASIRYISRIFSTIPFGLGFFVQPFTKHRQTWHDIIAECLVVNAGKENETTEIMSAPKSIEASENYISMQASNTPISDEEEKAYELAYEELESGNVRKGIWAKVLSEQTDIDKQRQLYIKYRATQIINTPIGKE